jgi:hypothetical protein
MGTQPAAGVVQRLVEGIAVGAHALREDVDGYLVHDQGQRDAPLMGSEDPVDGVPRGGGELCALGVLVG